LLASLRKVWSVALGLEVSGGSRGCSEVTAAWRDFSAADTTGTIIEEKHSTRAVRRRQKVIR
jgi:hypothetical protein